MSRKSKKRVQYRWFPVCAELGLSGGIVASTKEEAEMWGARELYAGYKGFRLVRVRMEYKP